MLTWLVFFHVKIVNEFRKNVAEQYGIARELYFALSNYGKDHEIILDAVIFIEYVIVSMSSAEFNETSLGPIVCPRQIRIEVTINSCHF